MSLSSDCSISRLPLEILSKIFTFLGHSDQKVCRSVCLFWMQVKYFYLVPNQGFLLCKTTMALYGGGVAAGEEKKEGLQGKKIKKG